VGVDTDAQGVLVKIVDRVEVPQEGIAHQVEVLVLAREAALVDHKVTLVFVCLIEVLLWSQLENIITHLEPDRLYSLSYSLAATGGEAEGLVRSAVELRDSREPLSADFIKYIGRDRELGATSVDDRRVSSVFTWLLHGLGSIVHALAFKRPSSKPVGEILEGLKALSTADDLRRVVATEESIRALSHVLRSDGETDNGMVDDTIVLQRPQVVKLLLVHVLVGREAENSIGLLAQTLGLVQSEELELRALVLLEL